MGWLQNLIGRSKQKLLDNGIQYPFSIEELPDRYRLYNVPCSDEIYTIDWGRELLDDGKRHTQDEWAQRQQHQEFQLASGPEHYATMKMLYIHKDGPQSGVVKKVRAMFKEDFGDPYYFMMTSTRLVYNPTAPDKIIYNYNTSRETSIDVNLVGPDGYIADNPFEDALEALLGIRDREEIDKSFRWISGKRSYLWRVNSCPDQTFERALVLGVGSFDRFIIYANDNIVNLGPARGVVVREGGVAAALKKSLPGALSIAPLEDLNGAVSIHSNEGALSNIVEGGAISLAEE